MTDPAVPIPSVDALHAHFVEWIRYLDAKGRELEAQLDKLEASKKKKANGMKKSIDGSVFQKILPRDISDSADTVKESASPDPVDWLDDRGRTSADADQLTPQAVSQPYDSSAMDEPVCDEDNPSVEAAEPASATAAVSRSDAEDDKDFEWLRGK